MFFNFLKDNKAVIKTSLCSFFGADNWEYSDEQVLMAEELASLFNGISVSEDSEVEFMYKILRN